jgi:hypothetical protein
MTVPIRPRGDDRQRERGRRRRNFRVEQLEARELLTFTLIHHAALTGPGALASLASGAADEARAANAANAPTPADTTGTLTPHEIQRQTFVGRFKGNYTLGPGRTTAQALQLSSLGYGGSNGTSFLLTNMLITVPTDPTQPVTGVVYIVGKNVATTGTQLIIDLQGVAGSPEFNGLPTQYTWTVDPASAGIYSNAAGYGTGQGTMNVQFFRPGPGPIPGSRAGQMNFAINGLIDTGGVFNNLGVLGEIPQQP